MLPPFTCVKSVLSFLSHPPTATAGAYLKKIGPDEVPTLGCGRVDRQPTEIRIDEATFLLKHIEFVGILQDFRPEGKDGRGVDERAHLGLQRIDVRKARRVGKKVTIVDLPTRNERINTSRDACARALQSGDDANYTDTRRYVAGGSKISIPSLNVLCAYIKSHPN